jgi:succinate-semialdehyde dehydrogenase/glutarate-semialdehyde dehydrogenase
MTRITTTNPATEATLSSFALMSRDDAFAVVEASHAAHLQWRSKSLEERASYLMRIAQALRSHQQAFAQLMTQETGKLLRDGNAEVELCAQIFEYTAEHGPQQLADEPRTHSGGSKKAIVAYCPIGVVYSIQPWNFPLYQPVRVLASNLMAGNGVVLKHASLCTGSGLMLRDVCLKAGLPKGLFDVLLIDHETSDEVIAHTRVRGVTMTGSDESGRHIGQVAAKHLKKTVLELGSNDAYLVLEDADIELAIKTSVEGRLYNNGETCVSAKRFVVTAAVYEAFVAGFVKQMKAVVMGDPMADATQLGPVSSKAQFDTLCEQVAKSIEGGAKLLCGGQPDAGVGYFYPPTVLGDCPPGTPAYEDELFGPVASIIRAKDAVHAMQIANDSRYGLGGGIFTADADRALALARDQFDTGMVRINSFGTADPNLPFGGVKDSGYGREHGGFGIKEFVNAKAIFLP